MKTLILNASPKKQGITSQLSLFIKKLTHGSLYSLCDYQILPCTGCEHCENFASCIISHDDMTLFYRLISNADQIVVISPVYFLGLPAHFKALIDRTQVFWHHPLLKTKNCLAIMHGERANSACEPCFEKTWQYIFTNWGAKKSSFSFFSHISSFHDFDSLILNQLIHQSLELLQ